PQPLGFRADAAVALFAEGRSQSRSFLDRAVLHDPGGRLQRIDLAHVQLHDERLGAAVGTVERRRKARVVSFQQMNRASEVAGIVLAADRPDGTPGIGTQAAEQTECEEPVTRLSTHTTSVSNEPSGCSSSVR